tara:strand:+ start:36004 stop:37170 length:1167 start_codon:yes stop_codon:yes gene_type:complete
MEEENNNLEQQESEEQVKSFYGEGDVDISIPDMLIPAPVEEENKNEIKDACDVAFKFAFVGTGQGGSRIAETFHKLGYRRLAAINTAQQDLNTIQLDHKLCIGEGGAGKDLAVAEKYFKESREDVIDFLRYSFGDSVDKIFVCAGAGGGSGAGTLPSLVDASLELTETIEASSKKVGVILALPKKSEGARVAANAHKTLKRVWKLVEENKVSPLIILDNEKIGKLYPNLVVSNFWRHANSSLAGLFHLFNLTSAKDSTFTSFDKNDYNSILESGLMVLGASPVDKWDDPVSVSRAIRENVKNNVLSGGVDLSTGSCAGAVIIGGKDQLDNIPQSTLDQAFEQLVRMLKQGGVVHRGIYIGDKHNLTVFTAIGGLGLPEEKLRELQSWS